MLCTAAHRSSRSATIIIGVTARRSTRTARQTASVYGVAWGGGVYAQLPLRGGVAGGPVVVADAAVRLLRAPAGELSGRCARSSSRSSSMPQWCSHRHRCRPAGAAVARALVLSWAAHRIGDICEGRSERPSPHAGTPRVGDALQGRPHALRIAVTLAGSMRDARCAGSHPATAPTSVSAAVAPASVTESRGSRPKSSVSTKRDSPHARAGADDDAGGHEQRHARQHEADHARRRRAERQADADLAAGDG